MGVEVVGVEVVVANTVSTRWRLERLKKAGRLENWKAEKLEDTPSPIAH
ncbi:MAG: hypothetical protein LBM04_05735 [Opitutaceae bacterium]|jgi:hypothetical protein|nr:hypothetical protein [Opitutaceae bacterium]